MLKKHVEIVTIFSDDKMYSNSSTKINVKKKNKPKTDSLPF